MIFLETQRLLFRSHEAGDEADFVRMQTDPEVRRYAGGGGSGWPLEKALDRFHNEYLGQPTETYGLWAAILKEENKYIGCCGLRAAEDAAAAYLGFYFAKPYWRRGFATESAQAFINLAFTRLRLAHILAEVQKGNEVSEHILEKFGFKYSSQEEIPASGRTIVLFKLSHTHWEQQTK
jgi:RimJ/RimL family protein N-acetyltransferase